MRIYREWAGYGFSSSGWSYTFVYPNFLFEIGTKLLTKNDDFTSTWQKIFAWALISLGVFTVVFILIDLLRK